ncbi:glycosyltransferase family A protein [Pokkaliibacter sp. MBI-7]|uniref:glycosyltransferase family 2 protein n=1 Tax=Pokkaliibacter sp. MBI-7 TaxID=3040600 RepID=UPI002448F007|nr:glycosyltransferase family A protein [Pokkaliibacter sp. MBI-7]MDH2433071.1 glycosyltransferase family A protein [Pokkaliibacter sp. MBI-7]
MNIPVVVIIATAKRRTRLLLERALLSVFRQQGVNPLCIYIVDDNGCDYEHEAIVQGVKQLREFSFREQFPQGIPEHWFPTRVIRNHRTQGHSGSGAWNTGAETAWKAQDKSAFQYLAILDDDDEWYPAYLSECYRLSQQGAIPAAAVVSSFHRKAHDLELLEISADALTINQFFVGNPGWQGSNTFIDATLFWQAGGFDESMRSTLDRDLAVRVLECCQLRNIPIVVNKEPLWCHHTQGQDRVTLCSASKRQGLDQFYNKYSARMAPEVLQASLSRASRLFGYHVAQESGAGPAQVEWQSFHGEAPIRLIIGVASSSARNVREQMLSLSAQIRAEPQFAGHCQYVVLTNGENEEAIAQVVADVAPELFQVRIIDLQEQRESRFRFPYRDTFAGEPLHKKSIAYSRTLLQFFCWEMTRHQRGIDNVLILDDDLQFESLALQDGKLVTLKLDFLGKIARLSRTSTADMLISAYSDAPALPFHSSMRTQLLDIYYSLHEMSSLDQGGMAERRKDPLSLLSARDDYYYDLSSARTDHLEWPALWQSPDTLNAGDNTERLLGLLTDIGHLNEEANITRPLLVTPEAWGTLTGQSSFRRGGIALYRNLDLLVEVPNLSPSVAKENALSHTRRSDFISALYMSECMGWRIEKVSLPLRHHRRQQNRPCDLSAMKLANDIMGLCFYRVFRVFCRNPALPAVGVKQQFSELVDHYLTLMSMNQLRSEQLISLIMDALDKPAWITTGSEAVIEKVNGAKAEMVRFREEHLSGTFHHQVNEIRQIIESFDVYGQMVRIFKIFSQRTARLSLVDMSADTLPLLGVRDELLNSPDIGFAGTGF